jgi:hypothetical protein
MALRDPAHRPAEHRHFAAEEIGAALHQPGEAVVADRGGYVVHHFVIPAEAEISLPSREGGFQLSLE